MKLGCIGDDFTGSSDIANTLAKEGMRVALYPEIPNQLADPAVEAGVVSLKSRTVPVADAVRQSLAAADWLLAQGCEQIVFKYCSTFDSTPEGNIGPVIDALMSRLEAEATIVCPAFPATGRSLYQGHLFVNGRLLSRSGMEHHPLTPMTEPDIRQWLSTQTAQGVGHVPVEVVFRGTEAIDEAIRTETGRGRPVVVVDAIRDDDLRTIGAAAKGMRLVTGGSGIAMGLPANFAADHGAAVSDWTGLTGRGAILAGSTSSATRAQVTRWCRDNPSIRLTAEEVMQGIITPEKVVETILVSDRTQLVYSSADPDTVKQAQDTHGRDVVAGRFETFFADTAEALVAGGVKRLVTAGGETSGAVVERLAPGAMRIGPEIAPGVPALLAESLGIALALKSGNFGAEDFFETALAVLGGRNG